jgi:tetratricopeptide (TPR) repeat protein
MCADQPAEPAEALMGLTARIFISHSREDLVWCRAFVEALRWVGADVSYGEQRPFAWSEEIERDLANRSTFIVVLSPAATIAPEVQAAVAAALARQTPLAERLSLGVIAGRCVLPARWAALEVLSGPRNAELSATAAAARVNDRLAAAAARTPPVVGSGAAGPGEVARAAWERGEYLRAQHQPAEALALYERALAANDTQGLLWFGLGSALVDLKRYEDALAAFDRAVAGDATLAAAWYAKGQIFAVVGAFPEAVEAYERALRIHAGMTQALIGLGDALGVLRRYAEALEAFERALTLDPALATVWNRKGNMLQMLERQTAARQRSRSHSGGRQADPPQTRDWLAEALEAYEQAVRLDPRFALAWSNLIHLLEAFGWDDEADDARDQRDEALHATVITPDS